MYLNCHTYFSFKYGTLSVDSLFREAYRCGVQKLVLTDINNTCGYIEMIRICKERKLEYPLEIALGIEFRRDEKPLYIAIARNNEGFEEINAYLSYHNNTELPLLSRAPEFNNVYIIYPWGSQPAEILRPYEFIGVRLQEINKIITSPYQEYLHKLVVHHPVTFKDKTSYNVHRLLRAIDQNTILSKLEEESQANRNEVMIPPGQLKHYYEQYPQIIANTEQILNDCHFHLDFQSEKNKINLNGSKVQDLAKLRDLAWRGFPERYKATDEEAKRRLEKELEVISNKGFESYYLITNEIVQFAKHKNFEHVGRGSGANSIVAYCLGLTNVDPIELDLYFERFLNPERSSPPDFDIDFSWKDRDEVTKFIFDQYGTKHTALLATHTTYKGRSILRELGKVFGLPKAEIDNIVEYPQQYRYQDHITKLIFQYAEVMLKMPANLSIHAGGVLITEKPIYAYTATNLPPKGFPTSHFEMHNAEDINIYKFDILSQRGLGHIKDAVALAEKNQGKKVDITQFRKFKKDTKIRKLLSKGHTMGCFYVESPAMRMLLGKLSCQDYITLVAASSIIRPGVARSGMMRAYIYRHHHPDDYEAIHPKMDELMKETYGVMVYQEDVIKVAHHFAKLSLAEADVLRRGMSGKFRSRAEFKRVEQKFMENCTVEGYPPEVTARVWYEIESFSGYSFSKGHSASYAVESYQSLYLKAHFPLEFMVGVINNFGGFYKTEFYFHEARMNGAKVEAPCVNMSDYTTNIYDSTIYMGFIHLKSLESKIGALIPEERAINGAYKNIDNFIRRVPISLEQICLLIKVGAFRFTGKSKRELLWDAHLYFGKIQKKNYVESTADLFETEPLNFELPPLERHPHEDAFDELELLGFPLCDPFLLLKTEDQGNIKAKELMKKLNKKVEIVGYLVTTKNTATKDGLPMHFGTFYDNEGMVFDTTHFPNVAKRFPFRGKGFYRLRGKVVEDFGYPMIEINWMDKEPMISPEEIPSVRLKG